MLSSATVEMLSRFSNISTWCMSSCLTANFIHSPAKRVQSINCNISGSTVSLTFLVTVIHDVYSTFNISINKLITNLSISGDTILSLFINTLIFFHTCNRVYSLWIDALQTNYNDFYTHINFFTKEKLNTQNLIYSLICIRSFYIIIHEIYCVLYKSDIL